MKTAVVGAGAMGSLFGALLAEAGHDVWLLDVWAEHVGHINLHGLTVEDAGQTRVVRPRATTDPAEIGQAELVIVFVKSTQTRQAAPTVARLLAPDGLALTLQNGLGNAEALSEAVPPERVLAGTTTHGANLAREGHIRHAGKGQTVIGFWSGGDMARVRTLAETFIQAKVATEASSDIQSVLWNKLLVNVGINAICALTGIKNGELLDLDITKELSRAAVEEAMGVARALGVKVKEDAVETVFQVARATAANRASMGQDVDHKRQTEIMAINGAVVEKARRLGVDTPVNLALTALVRTMEAHYRK